MRFTLYQLMVIAVYALAGWDVVRLQPLGQPGRDAPRTADWRKIWRITCYLTGGWLLLQITGVALLLLTGSWNRVESAATFYWTNAVALFIILPAGILWQKQIGLPALPLVRGERCDQSAKGRLVLFMVLATLPVLLSIVLFRLVPWHPDATLTQRLEPTAHGQLSNLIFAVYLLLSAAVAEEVIWRHYFLVRLIAALRERMGITAAGWTAALITSLIFVCGHNAMINPGWLKDAQILMYGLALAVCQIKLGTESAIAVHLVYNTAGVILARMGS